jgi:hypothetical protein
MQEAQNKNTDQRRPISSSQKNGAKNMLRYILWSFCDNYEWFLGW